MKRMLLLVEGQTEETFVRETLEPHFRRFGVSVRATLARTSPGHRGGVVSYGKIRRQLQRLCKTDSHALVSMMIDLYGLPNDFPGRQSANYPAQSSGAEKAGFLEQCMASDIDQRNFIPFLMVHEFEAILFTKPEQFNEWTEDSSVAAEIARVANQFSSPEDINDHPHSAPSKRIASIMPEYVKTAHGPIISEDIGLDTIRQSCPHLRKWLERLEHWALS